MAFRRSRTGAVDRRYRALRIWWPTSVRLRWQARADRRAGLPLGLEPGTTPVLQGLVARHDDACERERTRFHVDTARRRRPPPAVGAALPAAVDVLVVRKDEVARAAEPLTAELLAQRLAGEQDLDPTLVRQRRQTTHDRVLARAREAREQAQHAVDALLTEQAELTARVQNRFDVARSRVLRYGDLMDRQAALYRRTLVRKHPDREALAHDWDTALCPAPSWVLTDAGVAA